MREYKPRKAFIAAVYVVLFAIGVGLTVLFYVDVYSLVYAACGALATWIFAAICHEVGHILAAKASGFDILRVSICGFVYAKTKKKKFSYSLFTGVSGEVAVIPKKVLPNAKNGERYATVVLGGLIGHALAIVAYMLALVLVSNLYVRNFFTFFTLPLASFVVNGLSGVIPTSDASVLSALNGYSEEIDAYDAYLNSIKDLANGKSYAELDGYNYDYEKCSSGIKDVLSLFSLRRDEELGNYPNALATARKLIESGDSRCEVLSEIAFVEWLSGYGSSADARKDAVERLDESDEPFAHRLRLLDAKLNGDEKYVGVAVRTALKACDESYFKGDGLFNKKMIEKLVG